MNVPIFLAPMAGYTDAAFRSICLQMGCGVVVTEMVNAYGLTVDHKRTWHYLDVWPDEHPVGAQLYGSNVERMIIATSRVAALNRFDFIDLNAGCPMPKIKNRGDGAGLMRDPAKLFEIVKGMVEAAEGLPVTVKTRIGWNPDTINVLETTAAAEEAGAVALFLHGRVASVRHSGPSNWEWLARIKAERKIPVIGNGGIAVASDVERMIRDTRVDGVMIGRAALGNPWLFAEIRARMGMGKMPIFGRTDAKTVRAIIVEHLHRQVEMMKQRGDKAIRKFQDPELAAVLVFRAHLVRYLRGYRGLRQLLLHLEERMNVEQILRLVDMALSDGVGLISEAVDEA